MACLLSVVVPAFNEEHRIQPFLAELVAFKEKSPFLDEVIIVDDGSTDATLQALKPFESKIRVLRHEENRGKGAAVRTGLMAAKGDLIAVMDADGATRASQLPSMVSALKSFDLVLGARNLPLSKIRARRPFLKRLSSRLFNFYANRLFKLGCNDVLCGFKGLRRRTARQLASSLISDGWIFDVELLARARALNARLSVIPIEWGYVKGSKMKVDRETLTAVFALRALKKRLQSEGSLS